MAKQHVEDCRLTIRLPPELRERLQIFAAGRSTNGHVEVSAVVREALEVFLRVEPRQTKHLGVRQKLPR